MADKKRQTLNATQLQDLYYKTTHGKTPTEAIREVGLPDGNPYQALRTLKRYMRWIADGSIKDKKSLNRAYTRAAKACVDMDHLAITKPETMIVTTPGAEIQPVASSSEPKNDRYAKLNLSFSIFSDAVYRFIEEEVEERVAPILKENAEIKEVLGEAQVGNWGANLKKRLEGK